MDLEADPCQQLVSAIQTQNPLGTPEHIATFLVNTLFSAIVEAKDVSEKMTVWFKAYRYVTTHIIILRI